VGIFSKIYTLRNLKKFAITASSVCKRVILVDKNRMIIFQNAFEVFF
jgi:hypothetical protein